MKIFLSLCIILISSCLIYEETDEEAFNTKDLFESPKMKALSLLSV